MDRGFSQLIVRDVLESSSLRKAVIRFIFRSNFMNIKHQVELFWWLQNFMKIEHQFWDHGIYQIYKKVRTGQSVGGSLTKSQNNWTWVRGRSHWIGPGIGAFKVSLVFVSWSEIMIVCTRDLLRLPRGRVRWPAGTARGRCFTETKQSWINCMRCRSPPRLFRRSLSLCISVRAIKRALSFLLI